MYVDIMKRVKEAYINFFGLRILILPKANTFYHET